MAAALCSLLSALRRLHADERGGLFDDFWDGLKKIGGIPGDIADAIRDFVGAPLALVYSAIAHGAAALIGKVGDVASVLATRISSAASYLAARVWDLATLIYSAIANGIAAAVGKLGDVASLVYSAITNGIAATIGKLGDVASLVYSAIANGISAAVGKLGDVASLVYSAIANGFAATIGKVWDSATLIFAGMKESTEAVGGKLDDVGGALKDLPADVASKMRDALVEAFGFAVDQVDDFVEIAEAVVRGELTTMDQLMGRVKEKKPHSTTTEVLFYALFIPNFLMAVMQSAGQIMAEPLIQTWQRDHAWTLFDPDDLRELYLRDQISRAGALDELQRQGFTATKANQIMLLWEEVPPASDLIRMAVREVFSPEVVERFGQDQDFPAQFAQYARQQGLTDEWARRYWASHWDLPSPEQGFTMFHRGVIDFETLQVLLRALDVMPFWRAKLTEIAYNTVTRVDARRMFQAGVWDRARVEREYLRQGYAPDDATGITAWTVREYAPESNRPRDLTRAAIEQAYRLGRIGRDEALQRLQDLDYEAEEADFYLDNIDTRALLELAQTADDDVKALARATITTAYREGILTAAEASDMLQTAGYDTDGVEVLLALEDFRNETELVNLRADVVKARLRRGEISPDQAEQELAAAGTGLQRAALLRQRWELELAPRTRDLTEAQLRAALRAGLIDGDTYATRLVGQGWAPDDAAILLALALPAEEV